jgi:glycosyltransferase involved in cell wall biosynthesis
MKPKRLRILFICKLAPVNFTTSDAYFALPNWLSKNSDLFLLCPKPPRNMSIPFENQLSGLFYFKPDLRNFFKVAREINYLMKTGRIDVIITGVDEVSLLPGILLSMFRRTPLITVCEDHPFWARYADPKTFVRAMEGKIRTFLLSKFLGRAERILCFIEGEVLDFLTLPKGKIVQLINGVQDSILREAPRESLKQPTMIGYIGAIEKSKGALEMLHVLFKIRSEGIDAKITFIGNFCNPAEKKIFEGKCNELALRDAVRVTGYLKHAKALQLLEDCAVCLHAYRPLPWLYYNQVLKVTEYMALGKPVVSWDYPGVRRLLGNGRAGILVEPGDLDQMAEEVKRLILDQPLRRDLEHQARELVKEKFVWSKIGREAYFAIRKALPDQREELGCRGEDPAPVQG